MSTSQPVERRGSVTRISYAQNMEDVLLDRIFRGHVGTYVDVGANHPFVDSNTYYFYVRGWRGVNLEPAPRAHALFVEHRPHDRNLAVAASDREGSMIFYEVSNDDGLTGLSTLEQRVAEDYRQGGFRVHESSVPVRTLESIIEEYGIEPPDLLSVDVESHEAAVLRGTPFDRWRPRVLVIESTAPLSAAATHAEWEPMVLAAGYRFAAFNGVNRFYLRDDLAEHLPLFATPVNALDQYLRQEVVALSNRVDELRSRAEAQRAAIDAERTAFERERAGWEWAKAEAKYISALWDRESASHAADRAYWKSLQAEIEAERAEWERQRREWEREREDNRRLIIHGAEQLRPYRLIDPFGLVSAGHGLARRVKYRLIGRS